MRKLTFLLAAVQFIAFRVAAQKSETPPLFQDEKPLVVKLSYSIAAVRKNTNDTVYVGTQLSYKNAQDGWDSLAVDLRARGDFRRKNCFFSPIRVKIKKNSAKETVFAGNKSLKLVLPCKYAKNAHDLIMKEYLCYKIYEAITPFSFHTRLADITLADVSGKQVKTYQVLGFFIEDDDLLADRLGGKVVVDTINLHPRSLHDTTALRHDFFEYLIANTDWSTTFYHNMKVIETAPRKYLSIPYDFDMSGLVNAPYATTNETLELVSVRDRLYRGYCKKEGVTSFVRAEYIALEPKIFEVINGFQNSLDPKEFAGVKKYVEEFFTIIKDNKKYKANIADKCRTP